MTKLVAIVSLVISFVLCTKAFRLPNNDLESQMDMFKNTGQKQVNFLGTVYPSSQIKSIGQVGGIDVLPNGDLLVFHRGDRVWTFDSFNGNNFNSRKYGPIQQNTIDLIDMAGMKKIDSWGDNMFYMPHGLYVDYEGKVWVTDVGLHQVFKFDLENMDKPELTLGEALKLGNDESHFCKPTDVAVAESNGHVFVSDGYCNKRVAEFDKNGQFVKSFVDAKKPLSVVHSITLVEPLNLVCTVSREEGRIVCFDISSGEKVHQITHKDMQTVYAIKYDPMNQVLHAATGDNHRAEASGFTFDASKDNFGKFLEKWAADDRDLTRVHDLAISPKGSRIYLGQLNGEIDALSYE